MATADPKNREAHAALRRQRGAPLRCEMDCLRPGDAGDEDINVAEVPGMPVTSSRRAARERVGWIGNTGVPDVVKKPHALPLHVSPVCPTLKMSAKLKLGIVARTSAIVYVGVWKIAVARFQYTRSVASDCPVCRLRFAKPINFGSFINDLMNAPSVVAY